MADHLLDVIGAEPIENRSITLATGKTQHSGPQRSYQQRRYLRGRTPEQGPRYEVVACIADSGTGK